MHLIGQKVQHQVFGAGVVTKKNDATLTVQFPVGEKMFLYPDAFHQFLVLSDRELQGQMEGALQEQRRQEVEAQKIAQAQWRKEADLRTMRISSRGQGVFSVPDGKCFQNWRVSTGTYCSGLSKGEPRVPDRMKANSMCLITTRPEGEPETQRRILGFFMAEDTFEGAQCEDGWIEAHPRYRICLPEAQQPLFWPLVTMEEGKQKWGNSTFKYLDNETGKKILESFLKMEGSQEIREQLRDFYTYYCRLNRLEPGK